MQRRHYLQAIAGTAVVSIAGCLGGQSQDDGTGPAAKGSDLTDCPELIPTTASLGEVIETEQVSVFADEPVFTDVFENYSEKYPAQGGQFVCIPLELTVTGDAATQIDGWELAAFHYDGMELPPYDLGDEREITINGRQYTPWMSITTGLGREIYPGESLEGVMLYTVPEAFDASRAVYGIYPTHDDRRNYDGKRVWFDFGTDPVAPTCYPTEPDTTTLSFGDSLSHRGIEMAAGGNLITSAKVYNTAEGSEDPSEGATWLLVRFTQQNTGDSPQAAIELPAASYAGTSARSAYLYKSELKTADGQTYPAYAQQERDARPIFSHRLLYPGVNVSGYSVFEVPEAFDADQLTLTTTVEETNVSWTATGGS